MALSLSFCRTPKRRTGNHLPNLEEISSGEKGPWSYFFSEASFSVMFRSS